MPRVALAADSTQVSEAGKWPDGAIHVSDADSASAADAGTASAPAGSRIMTWLSAVLDAPGGPEHVRPLAALATILGWKTGAGWCSHEQMAGKADVCERTARQATGWARSAGLLRQTRRGHRLSDGKSLASGWVLLLPVPGEQPATESQPAAQRRLGEANRQPSAAYPSLSRDSTKSDQETDSPPEMTSPGQAARLGTEGATSGLVPEARKLFPGSSPEDVSAAVGRLGANESKIRNPAAFVRSRKSQLAASVKDIADSRERARRDAEAQRALDQQEAARWREQHPAENPFPTAAATGMPVVPFTIPAALHERTLGELTPGEKDWIIAGLDFGTGPVSMNQEVADGGRPG